MKKIITLKLIQSFNPCYDPKEIGFDKPTSIKKGILKYRNKIKNQEDIIWLLCRKEFMSDKDMRLFAVWCARSTYQYCDNIDQRSIDAVDCAERYANGLATDNELSAAKDAARNAAWDAAWDAATDAARNAATDAATDAAWDAATDAAWDAAWDAARNAQINQLLTYF
jgi:hypothetical protein